MTKYHTSDGTYGRPRITFELADRGVRVNHKRDRPAPDLVQCHFKATSINQQNKTKLKQGWPYSPGSKPGITPLAGIPGWDIYHRTILREN
ncbi:MAG: transposase [Nitrosomonas oligotropha]|uniref:Transposase n=1 Tax=Nitrosomonas oligotropha TaxID=42354 RepID=A0A5C7W226_9PROT|nr:MAG: transposase [Nitrosomonas oligotropha]